VLLLPPLSWAQEQLSKLRSQLDVKLGSVLDELTPPEGKELKDLSKGCVGVQACCTGCTVQQQHNARSRARTPH